MSVIRRLMARLLRMDPTGDLHLLRTFLAVYRAGTITAAAAQLGLSQPAVTAQVRTLEQQAGHDLFVRRPRGVEPTPRAHELAARVARPLDELAGAATWDTGAAAPHPPVHLAGPAELLSTRALAALAPLVAGGVRLRVVTGLTDDLLEGLRAGQHDLVVSTHRPRGRSVVTQELASEDYVLVAGRRWAGAAASADGPEAAVRDVPLVAYAEDLPIVRRYWRAVLGRRLTAEAALTMPDLRGVVAAVVAGAGWSVLPRYLCRAELAAGDLVLLHDPPEPPGNTVFLVQRPAAAANPDVARVADALLDAGPAW
ncbi:HTH-type transcriptional regulator LeuO [Cellulomonas hominis]|nr:HTH-type transcriptional regulator LeuO [Cellulomonas hominis]